MTKILTLQVLVAVPKNKNQQFDVLQYQLVRSIRKYIHAFGFRVLGSDSHQYRARQQEVLCLAERQTHFLGACNTIHISRRSFRNDWSKVTCRRCLKNKPQAEML